MSGCSIPHLHTVELKVARLSNPLLRTCLHTVSWVRESSYSLVDPAALLGQEASRTDSAASRPCPASRSALAGCCCLHPHGLPLPSPSSQPFQVYVPYFLVRFPREHMKFMVSLNTKFYPVFIPPRDHIPREDLVSPVSSRAPAELYTVFWVG